MYTYTAAVYIYICMYIVYKCTLYIYIYTHIKPYVFRLGGKQTLIGHLFSYLCLRCIKSKNPGELSLQLYWHYPLVN